MTPSPQPPFASVASGPARHWDITPSPQSPPQPPPTSPLWDIIIRPFLLSCTSSAISTAASRPTPSTTAQEIYNHPVTTAATSVAIPVISGISVMNITFPVVLFLGTFLLQHWLAVPAWLSHCHCGIHLAFLECKLLLSTIVPCEVILVHYFSESFKSRLLWGASIFAISFVTYWISSLCGFALMGFKVRTTFDWSWIIMLPQCKNEHYANLKV